MDLNTYLTKEHILSEKFLKKYFNTNDPITIVEIGACEGEDTIRFSRLFPRANIYSIEALPENFDLLNSNLKKYDIQNVKTFNLAISNFTGIAQFHISSGNPITKKPDEAWNYGNKSSSLLAPKNVSDKHTWLEFNKTINVTTQTLDQFCKENEINEIGYLHVDVQGAEGKVIEGSTSIISKVNLAMLEVEESEFYENQIVRKDLELLMRENGFSILESAIANESGDIVFKNTRIK